MKKSILTLITLIAIGLASYAVSGPYLAIHGIKSSLRENDYDRLSAYVEFTLLRKNLKEQFNAAIIRNTGEDTKNNPFAMMMAGVASQFVDGMLDVYLTPSSIALLLDGEKPAYIRGPSSTDIKPRRDQRAEPLEEYSTKFVSTDRLYVYAKGAHEKEITIVLQRFGWEWKITNIMLPDLN